MSNNEEIVRSGYAAAEGGVNDVKTFVSLFTADGVILDVASGTEYRGKDLGRMVDVFATAFPDMHRDIHHVYETSDRVTIMMRKEINFFIVCYFKNRNLQVSTIFRIATTSRCMLIDMPASGVRNINIID